MRLVNIDYAQVASSLDTQPPTEFNTSFHTAAEAPDLERPSELPYSFKRWLPLILRSRHLPQESLQTITFSRVQARLLLDAAEGSIQAARVNRMFADDLQDEIIPKLAALAFPAEGLFMRLDACSAKDGVKMMPSRASLHSADEIVLRLVTSTRARNALYRCLEDRRPFELFFVPFDSRMGSENEYRVFCPPGGEGISAVSQYQWHKPWKYAHRSSEDLSDIVDSISKGSEAIRAQTVEELKEGSDMDDLLRRQGFTFDVLFDEHNKTCELVELNVFGVRSACGSCLFQWVRDREVLYSGTPEMAQFRVTM